VISFRCFSEHGKGGRDMECIKEWIIINCKQSVCDCTKGDRSKEKLGGGLMSDEWIEVYVQG
jgi:hypothetical protein